MDMTRYTVLLTQTDGKFCLTIPELVISVSHCDLVDAYKELQTVTVAKLDSMQESGLEGCIPPPRDHFSNQSEKKSQSFGGDIGYFIAKLCIAVIVIGALLAGGVSIAETKLSKYWHKIQSIPEKINALPDENFEEKTTELKLMIRRISSLFSGTKNSPKP